MKQPKIHRIYNPIMECMDRAKLRELQGKRLRETVELEYANVPLYRERMDAMGVKPSDINNRDAPSLTCHRDALGRRGPDGSR